MWAKWVLSNSGERYLDSIDLVIDKPSTATKREAIAYFILGGIKESLPLPAIENVLKSIGVKNPYRVLQSSLEDYERNRWVKETQEDYSEEEMEESSDLEFLDKIHLDEPPDIPKGFEDFKDHF